MLDKTSKKVIEFLQSQYDAQFLYTDDLPTGFMDESEFFAAVRYLEKKELVEIIKNQNGKHIGVCLSHEALHYKEFARADIVRYVLDNWIDFIALIASIIAVVVSCA